MEENPAIRSRRGYFTLGAQINKIPLCGECPFRKDSVEKQRVASAESDAPNGARAPF